MKKAVATFPEKIQDLGEGANQKYVLKAMGWVADVSWFR